MFLLNVVMHVISRSKSTINRLVSSSRRGSLESNARFSLTMMVYYVAQAYTNTAHTHSPRIYKRWKWRTNERQKAKTARTLGTGEESAERDAICLFCIKDEKRAMPTCGPPKLLRRLEREHGRALARSRAGHSLHGEVAAAIQQRLQCTKRAQCTYVEYIHP